MNTKSPGDYEVGYGKPPKKNRYAPGVSGNPRGRRKREIDANGSALELYRVLKTSLDKDVSVNIQGKRKQITLREYMIERYIQEVLKDPRAFANFFKLMERADQADLDGLAGEPMVIKIIGGLPDLEG
jgi:hypothetical protein